MNKINKFHDNSFVLRYDGTVKRYGQFCGLARALDIVGERWTALIIRELSIRDCRYSDIRDGLPGIATNLLADRLRHLEAHGVIERYNAPPPVATTLYRLTAHGEALRPILHGLGEWGSDLMHSGQGQDAFRGRWLVSAIEGMTINGVPGDIAPIRVRIAVDHEPVDLVVADGAARGELLASAAPDVVITTDPDTAMELLVGVTTLTRARRDRRATVTGSTVAVTEFDRFAAALREQREAPDRS